MSNKTQRLTRVGLPNTMSVKAIDRHVDGQWLLWLHTVDFKHGTFVALHDDGTVERITVREGDDFEDVALIKPKDGE